MNIYLVTNKINNKKYVGQTTKPISFRWAKHVDSSKRCSKRTSPYLVRAIQKYGKDAFVIELLDTAYDRDELNKKEEIWINKIGSLTPHGYNIRPGGGCSPFNDETKRKLSEATRRQMSDPDARAIISKAQRGRIRTPEQKEAMGQLRRGRKLNISEDGQRRRREIWLGKNKPVDNKTLEKMGNRWFRVFLKDGTIIGDYINMTKCAQDLGVRRSQVSYWIANKTKSLDYKFCFIDKDTGDVREVVGGNDQAIQVYDKSGVLLGEFLNKTRCAEFLGVNIVQISRWLLGKFKSRKYDFRIAEKRVVAC